MRSGGASSGRYLHPLFARRYLHTGICTLRDRKRKGRSARSHETCRSRHCQPPRGRAGLGLTGEETSVNRCLTIVSREEQRNELLLRCSATRPPSKSEAVVLRIALAGSDGGPAPTRTWTSNVRPAPLPISSKPAVPVRRSAAHHRQAEKRARSSLCTGMHRGRLTQGSARRISDHCSDHIPPP